MRLKGWLREDDRWSKALVGVVLVVLFAYMWSLWISPAKLAVMESAMPTCSANAPCPLVFVSVESRRSDGIPLKYYNGECAGGRCQYHGCLNCRGNEWYCGGGEVYCGGCDCYSSDLTKWSQCRSGHIPTCDEVTTTTTPATTTTIPTSTSSTLPTTTVKPTTTTALTTTTTTTTTISPLCNLNGVCEADKGETEYNCQDCVKETDWTVIGIIAGIVVVIVYALSQGGKKKRKHG